jgi:hypothetical protein
VRYGRKQYLLLVAFVPNMTAYLTATMILFWGHNRLLFRCSLRLFLPVYGRADDGVWFDFLEFLDDFAFGLTIAVKRACCDMK